MFFSAKKERNPQKFALQCKNSLEKCAKQAQKWLEKCDFGRNAVAGRGYVWQATPAASAI
jgi:hypothetical protein|nr:MAG TPA: hypothetical protein [Caudoviricetes sp.]